MEESIFLLLLSISGPNVVTSQSSRATALLSPYLSTANFAFKFLTASLHLLKRLSLSSCKTCSVTASTYRQDEKAHLGTNFLWSGFLSQLLFLYQFQQLFRAIEGKGVFYEACNRKLAPTPLPKVPLPVVLLHHCPQCQTFTCGVYFESPTGWTTAALQTLKTSY